MGTCDFKNSKQNGILVTVLDKIEEGVNKKCKVSFGKSNKIKRRIRPKNLTAVPIYSVEEMVELMGLQETSLNGKKAAIWKDKPYLDDNGKLRQAVMIISTCREIAIPVINMKRVVPVEQRRRLASHDTPVLD